MQQVQGCTMRVNGATYSVAAGPDVALLYVLRNELGLNGPKYGCGLGQCGACMGLVDGRAARACCLPVGQVGAFEVTTLEGLVKNGCLDEVGQSFVDAQAAQCGYCLNGMIMTVRAFINAGGTRSVDAIRQSLRFNLCRCGTHVEILQAACLACGVPTLEIST
jgi:nicotinate dehydrogenase subunit A